MHRSANSPTIDHESDFVSVAIPRSALQIVEQPLTVTQRTSERVLGIPRRSFLELAREYREAGGVVLEAGKLRIVEIEPLLSWLSQRTKLEPKARETVKDDVDSMANKLGLRLVRP